MKDKACLFLGFVFIFIPVAVFTIVGQALSDFFKWIFGG